MNRIIIMAKNRHFPPIISLREAITLHSQTTEALTHINATQFQQSSAGAALSASAPEGKLT